MKCTPIETLIMPFVICFLAVIALVAINKSPAQAAVIVQLIAILTGVVGAFRYSTQKNDNPPSSPPNQGVIK